jgi:DNA repair protein RecN (Recombination protein N)
MIRSLFIKNYILVDEIRIAFNTGLNIITGETGAGKSIIVNALGQLCGERGSPDMVRGGAKKAIIEAEIDASMRNDLAEQIDLEALGIDEDQHILIRKELNANGASRIFINDSPVTLPLLNQLSTLLFDFHGQHQHQRLLDPNNHIIYLDAFGSLEATLRTFRDLYRKYKTLIRQRDDLKTRQLQSFQMQDMYRFQDEELEKAHLQDGELEQLRSELNILSNIENFHQYGSALTALLYNGDTNAAELLSKAENELALLADLDEQFGSLKLNLENARAAVEEIGRFTEVYLANLEFDQGRMDFIHQRIAQLEFLLKKYQKLNIAELLELHDSVKQKLGYIDQFDEAITKIDQEIEEVKKDLVDTGRRLSQARQEVGKQFEQRVSDILKSIGMVHAQFLIHQEFKDAGEPSFELNGQKATASTHGFDHLTFKISSNAGEDFHPLNKIASGGEISRIMLAIKSVLAESDQLPVLIFDEIDAGISGKIAQIVGKNISQLATYHQIICVTHLPQISAFADAHYKVSKTVQGDHTFVQIAQLNREAQIEEIAHLLAGEVLSKPALDHARHLVAEAHNQST